MNTGPYISHHKEGHVYDQYINPLSFQLVCCQSKMCCYQN